jgi:sensor histidine kinase YesM
MMLNLQYLFVLGWTAFYYRIMKKRKINMSLRNALMTLAPPIAMFFVLTSFDEIALPLLEQGDNIYSIGFMVGLVFFISHHLSFYLQVRQMKLFDLQMQSQTLQSQLESQIRQNRLIEGAQKQAAEIRHEMKNLIFALQIELERQNYEGIETRLNALAGELKHYELRPYTAVPVIDAMISYKGETLREYGAEFTVTAEPLDVDGAFAYDLTSLLAVALDNAIDALAFETVKDAQVCLGIQRWKNMVFIQVTNPLTRPLKYYNGELQSAKDQAGHGFGLPALRRIVERYSGEVKISDKDGMFSLELMLED